MLDGRVIITIDPQPTLTAATIRFLDGTIVCASKLLCTSKRGKNRQICNWLNKSPDKVADHLKELFRDVGVAKDHPVFLFVECQTLNKSNIALEGFIKGWCMAHFTDIDMIAFPATTWQRIIEPAPKTRKDYEKRVLAEMKQDPNVVFVGLTQRKHDLVDTYLMLRFISDRFD